MSEEPRLPVTSCRGVEYDLLDALKRNPTTIFAGDDIAAVAADTITRQQAEIERLEAEVLRRHANPGDFRYWEGRYRDEKAENGRYREALEIIAKGNGLGDPAKFPPKIARAALNGEGK